MLKAVQFQCPSSSALLPPHQHTKHSDTHTRTHARTHTHTHDHVCAVPVNQLTWTLLGWPSLWEFLQKQKRRVPLSPGRIKADEESLELGGKELIVTLVHDQLFIVQVHLFLKLLKQNKTKHPVKSAHVFSLCTMQIHFLFSLLSRPDITVMVDGA